MAHNIKITILIKIFQTTDNIVSIINCLSINAVSGYGIGELISLLHKSESKLQLHGAIMSMFLLNNRKELNSLLFHHGAFDIVMQNFVQDSNDEKMMLFAVNGITMMAINLGIKIDDSLMEFESFSYEAHEVDQCAVDVELVYFKASDGLQIPFDKALLIKLSDVFNTMLSSSFREASDGQIVLSYIKGSALKYFVELLRREAADLVTPVLLTSDSMQDALQAYKLSKLYLLNSLEHKLYAIILKLIDHSNVYSVVMWSLENVDEQLFNAAITYYISSDVPPKDKQTMFIEAATSSFRDEWLEKIRDIILLNCNSF